MKWIVPVMGFTETLRERPTGIEQIWRMLRDLANDSLCVITPYAWNEDMRGLARFIVRNSATRPQVMFIGYSWGCGQAFRVFARECETLGIDIRIACLCDPVYRSPFLPTWLPLNPLSVSPIFRPAIRIPASVRRVEWVRQNRTIPAGHDLVAEIPGHTRIGLGRYLPYGHVSIDEAPEWRDLVRAEARLFSES